MIKKLLLTCSLFMGLSVIHAQRAIIYTTTADGTQSLEKEMKATTPTTTSSNIITLLPNQPRQSIDGFGYAMTYSSCYNLLKMPKALRHSLLKKTFSQEYGYGASYIRISIGCNDFSSTEYSLCDTKGSDDDLLKNFALYTDETKYVLPVLKEILAINPTVKIIAAPWTCPKWMKVSDLNTKAPKNSWTDGHLNPDYRETYAQYFVKFVNAMKEHGVNIYAVSPQNEPLNKKNCASLYMPWQEEAPFVKALASEFKKNNIRTKIYVFDHNYNYDNVADQDDYPIKVYNALGDTFEGSELVVGAAYHDYGGNNGELNDIHGQRSDKELIFSETSIGTWNNGRDLTKRLISDMKNVVLGTVNKWCKAVLVWNFMLDTNRGPNLDGGCKTCYGAVDVDPKGYTKLTLNSHYYVISHISSVVRPNAKRIATKGWWASNMDYSAYENPDGTHSIIFASSNEEDQHFVVYDGKQYVEVTVPANSVVSVLFGNLKDKKKTDLVANETYELIQNKSYTFSDEEVGAVDPDFFLKDLDGSGTYRFLGINGKYTVVVDKGLLTVRTDDAAVYSSGAYRSLYRAGLRPNSWDWPTPACLAQVAPGIYRMTVKGGETIHTKELNIKFFSTSSWGGFDINQMTGLAATKLVVSDNDKNIRYQSGQTLENGSTYVFTIKAADHSLDLQKQYDITDKASLDVATTAKAEFFKFTGTVTDEMLSALMDYKDKGGIIRYLDFSEATLTHIPAAFMATMQDASTHKANDYLEKVLLPNGVTEMGDEAFSSCHNLRVINLTNDLTRLGNEAFYSCQQLSHVTLPTALREIGNATFSGCPIADVYVTSSTAPATSLSNGVWNANASFAGIGDNANGTDKFVRTNAMTVHFGEGIQAQEYRNSSSDFLRLLTKSIYQDHAYDIKGQDHADLHIHAALNKGWNTICLPVTLTQAQVKKAFGEQAVVAEFVGMQKATDGGNYMKFQSTTQGMKAGVPYLIRQDGTAAFTEGSDKGTFYDEWVTAQTKDYYLAEDITLPSADKLPELQQVTHDQYTFVGNYNATDIAADNKVLYMSNGLFRYKNAGDATEVPGYQAYFIVASDVEGSGLSQVTNYAVDDVLTGISSITVEENNLLPVYDLMGRKVAESTAHLPAGIYIIGGKKAIIK